MRRLKITVVFLLFFQLTSCNENQESVCVLGRTMIPDNEGVPLRGEADAPVEFVLFGDYQCPGTHALWWRLEVFTMKLEEQGRADLLKIKFRHFPLSIHNRAMAAATAAVAAHLQGEDKFWEMTYHLMKTGNELTDEHILSYASDVGLDIGQFQTDMESLQVAEIISRDYALAMKLDLPGTPSAVICGDPVTGSVDNIMEHIAFLLN